MLRSALSRSERLALGEALERAKKKAPTRPHPMAPDEPPGNLVAGAASLVDRARYARDARDARDARERAVERVRQAIAS